MILVTGASGFIGNKLAQALARKFGRKNCVALSSQENSYCKTLLHNEYTFPQNYFVQNHCSEIETIVHAASFTPKSGSEANDLEKCNSSIYATQRLLNAEFPKLKKIIYLSSLDVYSSQGIINEDTLLAPTNMYALSKLYCENYIQKWAQQHKVRSQVLRIGHVYGPGEEQYKKIIPVTFQNILADRNIQIFGDGSEKRTFIYIDDVVQAIINAVPISDELGCINVVGGRAISILDIVNKMIQIANKSSHIEFLASDAKTRNLIFDNSKLQKYLLKHETELDEGLRAEYEHMKTLGA